VKVRTETHTGRRGFPARWRKFQELTRQERVLLMKAGVCLPLIGAMLRLLGFARCQSLLSYLVRPASRVSATPESLDSARSAARHVRWAAERGIYRSTCLPQSVLLWLLLRRQGVEGVLRIGVRKTANRLEAHAWVEYMGMILNDDPDVHERFASFDRAVAQ
jgi:hypothetical protein